MRTLFLAWQTPSDRAWFPVGRLDADTEHSRYRFSYTGGALTAEREGFRPMVSFPRIHECYESSDLFPMFKNRVLAHQRRDFTGYLASLALERKRSAHPPLGAQDHSGFLSGSNSSMRLFGQAGSFSRVSVSQAIGSMPFMRAVSSSD
jgi:hypothetical protein